MQPHGLFILDLFILGTFTFFHHFRKIFQVWTVRKLPGNYAVFLPKVSSTLFHLELLRDCENSPVCLPT